MVDASKTLRYLPWAGTGAAALLSWPWHPGVALGLGALFVLGLRDVTQTRHAVLRNYPLTGHFRYALEFIRPEIRQYFVESDEEQLPFSRHQRAMVYARAKGQNDKRGFGTLTDPYAPDAMWLCHAMRPVHADASQFRVMVGQDRCAQPYAMSVFNVSGMSFGALSGAAVRALNKGAAMGGFAHNTGEGSVSVHHRQGGDLVWQIASGYFGCRTADGRFDPDKFAALAADPQIKMIEVKLSQGAKPGHGGVLPSAKVSAEIAQARGVPMGQDCVSPPNHSAFDSPVAMMHFVQQLRELSGGKPVGIKLCLGAVDDWFALAQAMVSTGLPPDFITIDGGEGGTGAAPAEFADHVGMPMRDALQLVHATLVGLGLRRAVKIGVAGKVVSAFDLARLLALGADWCNAARSFMFALGCIQSRHCHTDRCPTGVATQDPGRQRALVVTDKAERVRLYQATTLKQLAELVGAAGLHHPHDLRPHHLMHRDAQGRAESMADSVWQVGSGSLLNPNEAALWPEVFRQFFSSSKG